VKKSLLFAVNYGDERVFAFDYNKETLNVFDGKTMKLISTKDVSDVSEAVEYYILRV